MLYDVKNTSVLLIIIIWGFIQCCALEKEVPEEVILAFNSKFPDVSDTSWELESSDEWEVEFRIDDNNLSALFQDDGTWLSTEYDFPIEDIPTNVNAALTKLFNKYHIEEVEFVESRVGNYYEIELERLGKDLEIKVDTAGNLIQRSVGDDD